MLISIFRPSVHEPLLPSERDSKHLTLTAHITLCHFQIKVNYVLPCSFAGILRQNHGNHLIQN